MSDKYLFQNGGVITEKSALASSAGAGDAGKIPALDPTGRLDSTMMPVGIGAEVDVIAASENLAAGDFVNIYANSGVKCRKADATISGKEAHGFVLSAVTSGQNATVYRISQSNTQLTGMTPGARQFLATTAGGRTETAPNASGNVVQILGVAKSATELIFQPGCPIVLA
jgi:hypothetical protein